MSKQDYYQTLGVKREASADEIRKAYRKLSKENHPDSNKDNAAAAERFKQIQDAYSVLGDKDKREQYDQFGHAFEHAGRRGGGAQAWSTGQGGQVDIDLNDILGGMFGGAGGFGGQTGRGGFPGFGQQRHAARPQKGEDLRAEIEIPFIVAAEGGRHDVSLTRDGASERLTVTIPPGVNTGSVIRLKGQGYAGVNGGPAGDLLVTIRMAPHPWFRREANNLVTDVPITPFEAALGAKIDVPTLSDGPVVVTIPPETSSGTRMRLREKGIRDQKTGQRGDQFVVVRIVVPKPLKDDEQRLYRQLAEISTVSPREGLW